MKRRFIIGGASDNIHRIPKALYQTGTVIGVNDWFLHDRLDIWLSLDGHVTVTRHRRELLRMLPTTPLYIARANQTVLRSVFKTKHPNLRVFTRDPIPYYKVRLDQIKRKYNGRLLWLGTSCMAAIHLAICLGAEEIVLAGFDCYGNKRWNNYTYTASDLNFKPQQIAKGLHHDGWTNTAGFINRLFSKFAKVVRIWKTLEKSPLDCTYLDPASDYALNPSTSTPPCHKLPS